MRAVARPPGRCIYCAFRARQYSLQTRRLPARHRSERDREAQAGEASEHAFSASKLRYTGLAGSAPHRTPAFNGRARGDSVVRKFWKGGFADLNRREQALEFDEVLRKRLSALKDEVEHTPLLEQLARERQAEGLRPKTFPRIWSEFERKVLHSARARDVSFLADESEGKPILQDLREAYRQRKERGLDGRVKYHFYAHLTGARFTKSDVRNQQALADLRYPSEWFPATRAMQRQIHLHVGPTNSGKTYHALQRLEKADSGVYAGPLRLLAHEVYTRMKAKGKACSLITGEERRAAEEGGDTVGKLSACTVEMVPLNTTVDVAVIDEIQMLGNRERGWAWTTALLGVKAREVHLCGEERTVPLVKEICATLGEKLEIHHYQRLSPLEMAEESLDSDLRKLRKGDCIVSFSVMGIHALRKQIEQKTGKKVATVYGGLPPETRAQQARLFNDPNNDYDFLVASDAIGMGLNLAVKRIIFEAASKFDGVTQRTLSVADIKQIAGRAGRYRTATQANDEATKAAPQIQSPADGDLAAAKGEAPPHKNIPIAPAPPAPSTENTGFVTTLEPFDFPIVRRAMTSSPEPIRTAGLFPPSPILERFSSYFPSGTPFSYILTRLHELSQMHTRFHLCELRDQIWIADLIEPVQGLTVRDRNVICSSPAALGDMELWKELLPAYAKIVAEQSGGNIVEIPELPLELLEKAVEGSRDYLRQLERLHKGIVNYLWLSYRFAGIFGTRALAFHIKEMVEERIEAVLGKFSFSETERRKIAARREQGIMREMGAGSAEDEGEVAADGAEDGVGEEAYSVDAEVEEADDLEEQTTLTSGGDHVSGEEDVMLEDPVIGEVMAEQEEKSRPSSFAEWRNQQTRGESQGSKEADESLGSKEANESLFRAAMEGPAAAKEGDVEAVSQDWPAAVDLELGAVQEAAAVEVKDESSPDGVPGELDGAASTPEIELDRPASETQEVPPTATERRIQDDQTRSPSLPGSSIPPKHLAHLDVNISEMEREQGSRP